ncbi:MAG TPA: hypothetical protein VG842_09920 [Sediminibacterium sp.]|nr:hypothetical protein [Sediminibacterium sp.]
MRLFKSCLLIFCMGLLGACSHSGNAWLSAGFRNAARCTCLPAGKNGTGRAVSFSNSRSETMPSAIMLVEPDMNRLTW